MDSAFSPAFTHLSSTMEPSGDKTGALVWLCWAPRPPCTTAMVLFYGGRRLFCFTYTPSQSSHRPPVPCGCLGIVGPSPLPGLVTDLQQAVSARPCWLVSRAGHCRGPQCQCLLVLSAKRLPLSPWSLGSSTSVRADLLAGEGYPSMRVPFFLCFPAGLVPH